eukprot:1581728-Pleurochrysis_carterae.AAC.4
MRTCTDTRVRSTARERSPRCPSGISLNVYGGKRTLCACACLVMCLRIITASCGCTSHEYTDTCVAISPCSSRSLRTFRRSLATRNGAQ